MPPIKRTKFKLSPEQLLEMFYWLKLIRAFDERLSILVKQGKVRSGVYTGIGQEAIIVGTCYGLKPDDVADVREEHGAVERTRLGAAQRCQRAGGLRQHQHARLEPAGRGRHRAHL